MLQKLEDFYLAILRFVVILVAGVLLVAVVLLAVRSVDALSPPPEPTKATPSVSQSALKKSILTASNPQLGTTVSVGTESDPDQSYYNHIGASIKKFFDSHFSGQYNIDPSRIAGFVKESASVYEQTEVKTAYAKNLSENIDALLADKDLIDYAKYNEPGPTIDRIMNSFTEEFNRQITEVESANQERQDAYLADKAQSQKNLYMAVSAFGIFLLIVFLSIIIRIERNLRPKILAAS